MRVDSLRCPRGGYVKTIPVCSGRNFRVDSPPRNGLVRPELAFELALVLEKFGRNARHRTGNRVGIFFKPGIFGHHRVGRAADIYGVGGLGLDTWKKLWDAAHQRCASVGNNRQRQAIIEGEKQRNLGWQLYKTIQTCGRWSHPVGYPIQLFGPWTRTEGPWKPISDFLLNAHWDHIHVAK